MSNAVKIDAFQFIGKNCIAEEDGQKLFVKIEQLLKDGRKVIISFKNVTMISMHFLSVAIGQLYISFAKNDIKSHLRFEGLLQDDMLLLKNVIDHANKYYEKIANGKTCISLYDDVI